MKLMERWLYAGSDTERRLMRTNLASRFASTWIFITIFNTFFIYILAWFLADENNQFSISDIQLGVLLGALTIPPSVIALIRNLLIRE